MPDTITRKIIDFLLPATEELRAVDVRIGLGYTSVRLNDGNIGLAWTANTFSESCTHEHRAGTLAGSTARDLLEMLSSGANLLARSIGLATANALAARLPRPQSSRENTLDIINVKTGDKVVMAGYFGPVIPRLKATGCRLDILELNTDKPGVISLEEGRQALADCSVAIITGTTVVTNTLDGLLAGLGKPRAVVILGPSSIMCPQVFTGTPVTHIAGAWVNDAAAVEKIISEGGGTMILKKHMIFETICM